VGFPALRHGTRPMRDAIRLSGQDPSSQILRIASVLDDAAAVDERRDRVATMARAVARAGAKYAIAKAVKDKKGESAGKLANIAASMLERADVRSWHLLPQEVQVFRLAVPAGRRTLRLELAEGGDPSSVIELPPVVVRPGEVTIVPYRLWRDAPAAPLVAAR
jgi:hypothetical protein